ncbi:MAG: hypothetical protein NT113_08035 [Hyphomicrobiales bacterium]|jgi:hypothetical protein|nr:hypothetical protein [Hyphomicrobiales bacterium]
MAHQIPNFSCHLLDDRSGYAIDAVLPTGEVTQLVGVFVSRKSARDQIAEYRRTWATDTSLKAAYQSSLRLMTCDD